MGLSRCREIACLLYECRSQLLSIVFVAFGRSIGEVGAVMLVGGDVQYKTRVMTTAIMLSSGRVVESGAVKDILSHPASEGGRAFLSHWSL